MKLAIPSTLSLGYGREAITRSHYIRMGTLAGLSKNETLLSTPGELGDLWEIYLQAHGVKRNEPEDE